MYTYIHTYGSRNLHFCFVMATLDRACMMPSANPLRFLRVYNDKPFTAAWRRARDAVSRSSTSLAPVVLVFAIERIDARDKSIAKVYHVRTRTRERTVRTSVEYDPREVCPNAVESYLRGGRTSGSCASTRSIDTAYFAALKSTRGERVEGGREGGRSFCFQIRIKFALDTNGDRRRCK